MARATTKKAAAPATPRKRATPVATTPKPRKQPATPTAAEMPAEEAGALDRHTADLRSTLEALGAHVGALRTQVESLRAELDEARRQARAAHDDWTRAQGEAAAAHGGLGRVGGDARSLVEELSAHLRTAREQTKALARELGTAREQAAAQAEAARARRAEDAERASHPAAPPPAAEPEPPQAESGPEPAEVKGRNRLGVVVAPGVVVAEVRPETPAAAAGLAPGDVIEGVNDLPVQSSGELRDAVHAIPPGGEATFRIIRERRPVVLTAHHPGPTPPEEGAADRRDWLGVVVDPCAVVAEVLAGSPAAAAGLQPGDVLTRLNDEAVAGGEHLRAAIQALPARAEVRLRVSHGFQAGDVFLRLDDPATPP